MKNFMCLMLLIGMASFPSLAAAQQSILLVRTDVPHRNTGCQQYHQNSNIYGRIYDPFHFLDPQGKSQIADNGPETLEIGEETQLLGSEDLEDNTGFAWYDNESTWESNISLGRGLVSDWVFQDSYARCELEADVFAEFKVNHFLEFATGEASTSTTLHTGTGTIYELVGADPNEYYTVEVDFTVGSNDPGVGEVGDFCAARLFKITPGSTHDDDGGDMVAYMSIYEPSFYSGIWPYSHLRYYLPQQTEDGTSNIADRSPYYNPWRSDFLSTLLLGNQITKTAKVRIRGNEKIRLVTFAQTGGSVSATETWQSFDELDSGEPNFPRSEEAESDSWASIAVSVVDHDPDH